MQDTSSPLPLDSPSLCIKKVQIRTCEACKCRSWRGSYARYVAAVQRSRLFVRAWVPHHRVFLVCYWLFWDILPRVWSVKFDPSQHDFQLIIVNNNTQMFLALHNSHQQTTTTLLKLSWSETCLRYLHLLPVLCRKRRQEPVQHAELVEGRWLKVCYRLLTG